MQIPKKILSAWKKHYGYGDLKKAVEETRLNKFTISRAVNTGQCSDEVFTKLDAYFLKVIADEKRRLDRAAKKYETVNEDNN